jgi:hypothetical protein
MPIIEEEHSKIQQHFGTPRTSKDKHLTEARDIAKK